jgi:hypothetical protein
LQDRFANLMLLAMHTDRHKALGVLAGTLIFAAMNTGHADAAPALSSFSVTPSTVRAGAHPNLNVSFSFGDPSTGIKAVAVHLPAGLSADSRAIPYCARSRLVRNLCSPRARAGSLTVTAVAYGIELPVTRNIYNVRPIASERVRFGVPILGSSSRPGIAAEVPVVARPADSGLDMTVTGLPTEVGGYPVRLKDVTVSIRGIARTRIKKKVRRRPFLTNPTSCIPAVSMLEVTAQDAATAPLTGSSSFTPTGCAPGR